MKYQNYKLEDYLKDEQFIRWVNQPSMESDQFWKNWIQLHPEALPIIQQAREIILSTRFQVPPVNPQARQEVLNRIIKGYSSEYTYRIRKNRQMNFLKIAAAVSLLMVFGVLFWQYNRTLEIEEPVIAIRQIEKQTLAGQKLNLVLPDCTQVILNAKSTISYPETFGDTQREVFLSGEAFFEVTENPEKPFLIHTENLQARVLGTSFNINQNSVALLTGKVEVRPMDDKDSGIVLVPGQKAVHDKSKNVIYKTSYNYQQEIAWKDGVIFFEDANFDKVRSTLESWYGVEFELENSLKLNWTYTGSFENASLEQVLDRIAYLEGFRFKIINKTVKISRL
jgi:ferric-dicitrate binding protein FerR (iron transport regulator)